MADASLLPTKGLIGEGHWQGELTANGSARWTLPLEAASNLTCGEAITLPLQFGLPLPSPTERQTRLDLQLPIGEPVWLRASGQGGQIRDAASDERHGLSRFILTLPESKATIDSGFVVALDLEHSKLEQLEIWLTSPYGTRISLWNKGFANHTRLQGSTLTNWYRSNRWISSTASPSLAAGCWRSTTPAPVTPVSCATGG